MVVVLMGGLISPKGRSPRGEERTQIQITPFRNQHKTLWALYIYVDDR